MEDRNLPSGTWTLVSPPPNVPGTAGAALSENGAATLLQLANGNVMIAQAYLSNSYDQGWLEISPPTSGVNSGNYAQGTWGVLPNMTNSRSQGFLSNVLPNDDIFVVGGDGAGTGEIFNPNAVPNSWQSIVGFPPSTALAPVVQGATALLPNGTILVGSASGPETYIFDPVSGTYTQAATKLRQDPSAGETWITLPDNSILSVDASTGPGPGLSSAQAYIPSQNVWVDAGTVPVALNYDGSVGPAFLLPDGRVFFVGGSGYTAYYTLATNSWTAGPVVPQTYAGSNGAPGAIMPNGDILLFSDQSPQGPAFYEIDPVTNTYQNVTPTQNVTVTQNGTQVDYSNWDLGAQPLCRAEKAKAL